MESNGWRKTLLVVGGSAAIGATLWYLFRDDPELTYGVYRFQVSDKKGMAIGIRQGPDVFANRVGEVVPNGTVFDVTEVVKGTGEQRYFRLADGRGWVFTHSPRDGRLLIERLFTVDLLVTIAWSPSKGLCIYGTTSPEQEAECMLNDNMAKSTLRELRQALAKEIRKKYIDLPLWALKLKLGQDAVEDIDLHPDTLIIDFAKKFAAVVHATQNKDRSNIYISCYAMCGEKIAEINKNVTPTMTLQELMERLALHMRAPLPALFFTFPDGRTANDFSSAAQLHEAFALY